MAVLEQAVSDVEMKSTESPPEDMDTSSVKKDTDIVVINDIRDNIRQIEKGVLLKENRFISRVLRTNGSLRKRLNSNILSCIVNGFYTFNLGQKNLLLKYFNDEQMEIDGTASSVTAPQKMRTTKSSISPLTVEVDSYLNLLVVIYLIDQKRYSDAKNCADTMITKIRLAVPRQSMDLIAAKCYFYTMRSYELAGELDKIRAFFHFRLRSCTLRNDYEGQAVIINCLLRHYLHYSLYDQADKLVSKSIFPESATNNEWARYLYYLGRIKAARLEYSDAHTHLIQALRKAPQVSAIGFRQAVQKLIVTVQLLLGDIPDRQVFRNPSFRFALIPYFQLTQAVRLGDLHMFADVLEKFTNQFGKDHTYTLIIRLRHNVIKTAVRAIASSYSRITPNIIADKLELDSTKDAECIITKAIRDGVIEAIFDPVKGYMQTKESVDIYRTSEPQIAFHQRTSFCLELYNQSVKAMRYPPKSYGKDLESAEERREREQQDLELAKEMAEEDDDAFP